MLGSSGDEATVASPQRSQGEGSFLPEVPCGGRERDAPLA